MRNLPISILVSAIVILAFLSAPIGVSAVVTTTITGWNVPSGTTLGNGIVAFLLPILIAGFFMGITRGIGLRGDFNTWMLKFGFLVGGILGMLSLSSTPPSVIPFALPIVAGIYLFIYAWKRV